MGGHSHCHNLRGTLYGNHATILSLCLSYRFALEIQSIFYFKEIEIETYVKKEIRNLKKENNINKLSYLYYECFNKKETNKDKMIENFDYYLEKDFL